MPTGSKRADTFWHGAPGRRWSVRSRRMRLLVTLLAVSGVPAALAEPPRVPALVEPASQEHYPGKVIFVQLVTPDLAAAKTFYAGLFGWTFRDLRFGETVYAEAYLDGRPVAGLVEKRITPEKHRQPAWMSFISATDVDALAKTAVQSGGKLLFGPASVPDLGREAILADPQGAVFAVLNSSSGDPPDILGDPGEWIWSTLITTTPDTDAAFYQTLFDYEVFDLPSRKNAEHYLLASGNYARASVNPLPAKGEGSHPHWLSYVRVEDATRTAAKVIALGGQVLVQPRVDRHGGKIAVVADPFGAPFGIMEWSEEGREMSK